MEESWGKRKRETWGLIDLREELGGAMRHKAQKCR